MYWVYFLSYWFGLFGVWEYLKGINGLGDIDVGLIFLGIGGVVLVVGVRVMLFNGDCCKYIVIWNSIEGFGIFFRWSGKKKYFGGYLVIVDVFIVWFNVRSCECMDMRIVVFWFFYLYSLLFIFSLSWLVYKI